MSLKFKKVQRKIMFGADKDKVKTYAMAKASGYCDMAKLCELISNRSAMSSADVKAILDSLNWAMGLELRSGNIVQVGEFGNFRLSVNPPVRKMKMISMLPKSKKPVLYLHRAQVCAGRTRSRSLKRKQRRKRAVREQVRTIVLLLNSRQSVIDG